MARKLIFCSRIHPSTFVLYFEKAGSWSVRDYSQPGAVIVQYAVDFGLSAEELSQMIQHSAAAPAVSANDLEFWHTFITSANARLDLPLRSTLALQQTAPARKPAPQIGAYPVLDEERLLALPKARKAEDMRRIRTSPNSEDWVTWNAFALAQALAPSSWWPHFVNLAKQANPALSMPANWEQDPTVHLWRCVSTPPAYERVSRMRMAASGNADWVRRSRKPGPVEGDSEIDITIYNDAVTLFVEAKLGSDISMDTTYDPTRNQVIRNIDCLIADARGTTPLFWMLVRDMCAGRAYTQLLDRYRREPDLLCRALPHRDPLILRTIAEALSLVLWKDFITFAPTSMTDTSPLDAVRQELSKRVGALS